MPSTPTRSGHPAARAVAAVACLGLLAVSCSDDDASSTTDAAAVTAPSPQDGTAPDTTATVTTTTMLGPTGPGCDAFPASGPGSLEEMAAGSTAEAIAGAPNLSTLVESLEAAGLTAALAGEGPFTVFAPTDDAFAAVAGELDPVAADPEGALAALLALHVVDRAAVPTGLLVEVGGIEGVGGSVSVALDGEEVLVDVGGGPARVICGDIVTTDGIVHVVDAVLRPPPVDTEAVGGSQLFTVDLTTGVATSVGGFGAERGVLGIAVALDGSVMYGVTGEETC